MVGAYIPEEKDAAIDELVAKLGYDSKAEFFRKAVDAAIAEGERKLLKKQAKKTGK